MKLICYRMTVISFFLLMIPLSLKAQETTGTFIKDRKTGTVVWFKHSFSEDSATWTGGSKNGFAEGFGTMTGFTKGRETSKYTGEMKKGKPDGKGVFTFWTDRKLEGNFSQGEPLFLSETLLKKLEKNVVSETDSLQTYVGDNDQRQLFYHAIVPDRKPQGVVVLMPGTWETTEHLLSSMSTFCELAYKQDLAVIALSINQRLTLTDETVKLMNKMLSDAIERYKLPTEKFVIGGFSMGGIFSLRYTEMANEKGNSTVIKPVAVFSCDGPCDLATIYNNFKRKLYKNPGQNEPFYGMKELETYCGGTPENAAERYVYYSPYSRQHENGGNARFLIKTPVRIYADVDPVWWMQNRHVDMYDLNALDQTAMIQFLNDAGNKQAEFINAYQKGIRLEGNRHPHSWSIIDPEDCVQWIRTCLKG